MRKQGKTTRKTEEKAPERAVIPRRKKDFLARYVAEKTGYSVIMVMKVRNGERNNEQIMAELVEAREKFKEVLK